MGEHLRSTCITKRTRSCVQQFVKQTQLLSVTALHFRPRKVLFLHRRLDDRVQKLADIPHRLSSLVSKNLKKRPDPAELLALGEAQHRKRERVNERVRRLRRVAGRLRGRGGGVAWVWHIGFEAVDAIVEEEFAGGIHGEAADEVLSMAV